MQNEMTCKRCKHTIRPVFASKQDGGIEFPPRIVSFIHDDGVRCENPRKVRQRQQFFFGSLVLG